MPISQLFAMVTMPPNSTIRTGSRTIPKSTPATATATAQPTPAPGPKARHECLWEPSARLTVPDDLPSGVYLGRLTTLPGNDTTPYWQSYVVFIVRDDRPADIVLQGSDNTWNAYNQWPSH